MIFKIYEKTYNLNFTYSLLYQLNQDACLDMKFNNEVIMDNKTY